jgi:hypothetical protein
MKHAADEKLPLFAGQHALASSDRSRTGPTPEERNMSTTDPLIAIVMTGPDAVLVNPHPEYDRLLAEQTDEARSTIDEAMGRLARGRVQPFETKDDGTGETAA